MAARKVASKLSEQEGRWKECRPLQRNQSVGRIFPSLLEEPQMLRATCLGQCFTGTHTGDLAFL